MSNLFQGIQSGLAELKTNFQGPMENLIQEQVPLFRMAEKNTKQWEGEKVVRPLRTNRNQGIGATSDGGVLPKIGRQKTTRAEIFAKYNYLRFGITGPMIKASKSNKGSFVRAASYELEMGYNDLRKDMNRQANWDGSGTLARVAVAASASNVLVIKGRSDGEVALKYIDIDTTFDVIVNGAVVASGITCTDFTSGNASSAQATIITDIPVTAGVNASIVRANSYLQEVQGLYYALDGNTTTIYGVDRAKVLAYQGNVQDLATSGGGNTTLSLGVMQSIFNEGLRRGTTQTYDAILTDLSGIAAYQKLLLPDKRYTGMEGDGSFGKKGKFGLEFNGIPIMFDNDSPPVFTFLNSDTFENHVLADMEFADESGAMMIAQTDTDAYEVRVRYFNNFYNAGPNSDAVLKNWTSP